MPKSHRDHWRVETRAVHAGRRVDPATGAVTPPIHLSTTFERDPDHDYPRGFGYIRDGNPNRRMLEECLAELEGGTQALAFSSGMAVCAAVLQGLEPGDHMVAPKDVYYQFRRLIGEVFGRSGIEAAFVDMTSFDEVRAAMRPNTRLVWIETPSNPLMRITDLRAVGEMARATKAVTVCDSTFASPILQRPLDFDIDMAMHSTTKYIGGHSDAMGGALVTRFDNYLFERARKSRQLAGGVPAPFDCWLTLRGISTLPYRMRGHSANAMAVARFLESDRRVEAVHYPGLESHPQHAVAARQMPDGFSGMLSFQVRGGRDIAIDVTRRVRVFTRATSLGGPHSFIEQRASIEGPTSATPPNLLRLSIGLEHPGDLIADLDQALG